MLHSVDVRAFVDVSQQEIKSYRDNNESDVCNVNYLYSYDNYGNDVKFGECYIPEQICALFTQISGQATQQKMSINVTIPGIYQLRRLMEKTDSQFRYVYFNQPGVYSLVKIYEFARSPEGQSWEGVGFNLGNTEKLLAHYRGAPDNNCNFEIAQILPKELAKILPYGMTKTADVKKTDTYRKIPKLLRKVDFLDIPNRENKSGKETLVDKAVYTPYTILRGRYIPMIISRYGSNLYYTNSPIINYLGSDGRMISASEKTIPGNDELMGEQCVTGLWKILKRCKTLITNNTPTCETEYYTGWYRSILDILAYDIENNEIIRSDELTVEIHNLMRSISESNEGIYPEDVLAMLENESGAEFEAKFNKYMASNGFPAFKANVAFPIYFHDAAEIHDWTEQNGNLSYVGEWKARFCISITYHGDNIINNDSGWVVVEANDDGTIRMTQSFWCQRVAKWTKKYAVDQKNSDWRIEDWLSGPFAEKIRLNVMEAPIVYYGSESNKKSRKRDILEKMRRLHNSL